MSKKTWIATPTAVGGERVGACAWSYTPNYVGETGNYGVSKSGVTTAAC